MKKLMIAAAALAAGVAMAATEEVTQITSANTVGFIDKGLEQGVFTILGVQFDNVEDGERDINKLITGLTGVDYGDGKAFRNTAPHIQVPNAQGTYDLYYYLNDGYYLDADGKEAYKAGWCDTFGTIAGDKAAGAQVSGVLTPGVAIWAKSVGATEPVTQAGQVPDADHVDVACPVVFALRSHMMPIGFNLNDASKVEFTDIAGVDYGDGKAFRNTAPHIQVPNAQGTYDLYYYLNDGYYLDADGKEAYKAGWCDTFGTIAGDKAAGAQVSGDILPGQGFWTKGVGSAFTVSFKK